MKNSNNIISVLWKENGLSGKLKQLIGNFDKLNNSIESINQTINHVSTNVTKGLGQVDGAVSKTSDNIDKGIKSSEFVALSNAVQNAATAFQSLSTSGSGFQQSMANLSASTGITGKDLDELNRIARESGKASGLGAAEAANAFTVLASKVQVSKVGLEGLKGLQQETITLSQAGGISMAESASALAETVNQFGLGADQANRVVNVLAAGSQNGSASITELAASLNATGTTAAAAGVSIEQTAGALEVLSQNNLKGAEAGTALSGIMSSMQSNLNIDLSETGLSTALESLAPLLGNTTELSRIFGETNVGVAQYLIENASSVAQMTTALTGTTTAQEQAAIRTGTTSERIKQMQAVVDDVKISLFEATGGASAYAGSLTEGFVVVAQLSPLITGLGKGLGLLKTQFFASSVASTAHSVIQKTTATATNMVSVAQTALNTAMKANPIGAIITGITLLVTGLSVAYDSFEGFRKVVDSVVDGIKSFLGITSKLKSTTEEATTATNDSANANANAAISAAAIAEASKNATTATEGLTKANGEVAASTGVAAKANEELNANLATQGNQLKLNLNTLGGIEQKISELRAKQKVVNTEQAIALEKEALLLEQKQNLMERTIAAGVAGNVAKGDTPHLKAPPLKGLDIPGPSRMIPEDKVRLPMNNGTGEGEGSKGNFETPNLEGIGTEVEKAKEKVLSFNESIWGSNSVIGQWANNATSGITNITGTLQEFGSMLQDNTLNGLQTAVGGLQSMGALMSGMGGIVEGAAGSWLSYGANILAMVAAALPQLLSLFGIQSALAVGEQAKLPFPLNIVAMAATVAGIAASIIAIPKPKAMANGGIVYGNTFAQVGEYPGAANNPEVIAPLNKLRSLIQPAGGFGGGTVEFVIKGNRLVGVMNKEANKNRYF